MLTYRKKKIHHAHLQNQDLGELCFWGAELKHANFNGANLQKSDLRAAEFSHSSFQKTNCQQADFRGAKLYNVDFNGANLSGALFSHPSILKSIITPSTILKGAVYWHLGEEKYFLHDLIDFKNIEKRSA